MSLHFFRTLDVTLDLKDPQYPEHNLGSLELAVNLSPKEGDIRDAVRNLSAVFSLMFSCKGNALKGFPHIVMVY